MDLSLTQINVKQNNVKQLNLIIILIIKSIEIQYIDYLLLLQVLAIIHNNQQTLEINRPTMTTTSSYNYNLRSTKVSYQNKNQVQVTGSSKKLPLYSQTQIKSLHLHKGRNPDRGQPSSQKSQFAFRENNSNNPHNYNYNQQGQFSFNHLQEYQHQDQYQVKKVKILRNKNIDIDDSYININKQKQKQKYKNKNKNQVYKMKSVKNERDHHEAHESNGAHEIHKVHGSHENLDNNSVAHNYNYNYNSSNSNQNESLIKNLNALEKDEIIQILMDQIKLKKISDKVQSIKTNNDHNDQNNDNHNDKINFLQLRQKYNDLVLYFQQYIQNTNQAQDHFKKIIQDLKQQKQNKQNKQRQKRKLQCQKQKQKGLTKTSDNDNLLLLIQKLQNSIQNYIAINNDLTNKLNKTNLDNQNLKLQIEELRGGKLKLELELAQFINNDNYNDDQKLCKQNDNSIYILAEKNMNNMNNMNTNSNKNNNKNNNNMLSYSENHNLIVQEEGIYKKSNSNCNSNVSSIRNNNDSIQNCSSLSSQIREMNLQNPQHKYKHYLNTIRVLEVTNKQIKIINRKLQKIVQKKSEKIRKLLQDLEKTTQEKLELKEQYMMVMCRLRQFQIINERNLQKSNTSTNYHQNLTKQQKQDKEIKALSTFSNYKVSANNTNPIKSFDVDTKKTNQYYNDNDNISLASRTSTQGPISYSYISQKEFKIQNKNSLIVSHSFFDEHQKINSQRNGFEEANINMKRKKQKQNNDFYEIAKQNYKLS